MKWTLKAGEKGLRGSLFVYVFIVAVAYFLITPDIKNEDFYVCL